MSSHPYLAVKLNVHVFPKSAGVVVFQSFGIAESLRETPDSTSAQPRSLASWHQWTASDLEDGIGHEHFVPDSVQQSRAGTADGIVLQNLLGGLCLPSSALPRDEDEVVVELRQHGLVGVVRQSVAAKRRRHHGIFGGQTSQQKVHLGGLQVRRQLKEVDPFVELHVLPAVDVQLFVRVDGHQQGGDVRLQQSGQTLTL